MTEADPIALLALIARLERSIQVLELTVADLQEQLKEKTDGEAG